MGRGPDPSSWMTFAVGETRPPCDSAPHGTGASTTVTTGRTLVLCVTACPSGMSLPRPQRWTVTAPCPGRHHPRPRPPRQARPRRPQTAHFPPPPLWPLGSWDQKWGPPSCAWWPGPAGAQAGWRYGMAGAGGRCVTTTGTCGTRPWSAGSWAAGHLSSQTLWLAASAGALALSGWTTWGAWGLRLRSPTALLLPGGNTTVLTMRTLASPALGPPAWTPSQTPSVGAGPLAWVEVLLPGSQGSWPPSPLKG